MYSRAMLFILLLAAVVVQCSHANADEWTRPDTYREVTFQVLNYIDWRQTKYIAENPDKLHEVDAAVFIGSHPSTEAVDIYMLASGVIHIAISAALPAEWRRGWQYVTIGGKAEATYGNYTALGIHVPFE